MHRMYSRKRLTKPDDIIIVGYKEDGSDHDANLRERERERARTT